jgi:hypothetical protein
MKKKLLTIVMAVACVFGVQSAVASAKTHSKSSTSKKHHKKNMKKSATAKTHRAS